MPNPAKRVLDPRAVGTCVAVDLGARRLVEDGLGEAGAAPVEFVEAAAFGFEPALGGIVAVGRVARDGLGILHGMRRLARQLGRHDGELVMQRGGQRIRRFAFERRGVDTQRRRRGTRNGPPPARPAAALICPTWASRRASVRSSYLSAGAAEQPDRAGRLRAGMRHELRQQVERRTGGGLFGDRLAPALHAASSGGTGSARDCDPASAAPSSRNSASVTSTLPIVGKAPGRYAAAPQIDARI